MNDFLLPSYRNFIAEKVQLAKRLVGGLQERRRLAEVEAERQETLAILSGLSLNPPEKLTGPIILDGSFDNPNYWYRLAITATAMAPQRRIGVTGAFRKKRCLETLRALGAHEVVDFGGEGEVSHRRAARLLLQGCASGVDILKCHLPEEFPATALYDQVLKRQRRSRVDLRHPLIITDVARTLAAIDAARDLFDRVNPSVILLSHVITPIGGALAWLGLRRGIPSLVLVGNYGVLRLRRIETVDDFFHHADCPSGCDINALPRGKAEQLAQIGWDYLQMRVSGKTNDIAAKYVFSKGGTLDKITVKEKLQWNEDRPIVSVYASNWFDFPHSMGMSQFADFQDWIETTHRAALENNDVYWLFRPHPVDAWYGGLTLADVLPDEPGSHVRLAPASWPGSSVMKLSDALITYHGTAGIEYAAHGKPVLVADKGWYHDRGFVTWPQSRGDYISALGQKWWADFDAEAASRRARIFAGWYFCAPVWQGNALLLDDSCQLAGWGAVGKLVSRQPEVVSREISEIGEWLRSGEEFYHTFKMRRANAYALSNVV